MYMKLTLELKARISTPTQFQNCLKLKKNEANIYFLPIIDMRGIISSDTSPHKVHLFNITRISFRECYVVITAEIMCQLLQRSPLISLIKKLLKLIKSV